MDSYSLEELMAAKKDAIEWATEQLLPELRMWQFYTAVLACTTVILVVILIWG